MRTPLLLVVPVALLTACSSGSGGRAPQSLHATSSPTSPTSPTSSPTSSSTPSSTSSAGSATTSAAPQQTRTATPVGPAASASGSGPAPGTPAKATRAGTYTYDSSGTVTFGTQQQDASGSQTLTVSPLRDGRQRSTLHSDSSGDTEQDVLVRDTGSYLTSLTLTSPAFTKQFRPAAPALLVPDPATLGKSWSWSATSTDGKTHVASSSRLVRRETVTIGGVAVSTVVLQTHLVLSGDVSYDAQLTTWWSPEHRLPVKTHTVGNGRYGGIPFKTDVTAVMRSVQAS